MKQKIARLALIEAALTLLWVILMILGSIFNAPVPAMDGIPTFVQQINILQTITYINAAALTVVAVLLYFVLYQYLKSDHPIMTTLGLVCVPLYGIFNLFVYGSQVTILPLLIAQDAPNVASWLQSWPESPIALLNQVAYALLGIPSILFAIALMRKDLAVRMAAVFLILNGIACILGLIGVLIDSAILSLGSLVGGVLFLVSVALLGFQYRRK